MKKGEMMRRVALVYLALLLLGIGVVVASVKYATRPIPPRLTREQVARDSLTVLAILERSYPDTTFLSRLDTLPPGGIRLDVDRHIAHGREFNDSNYKHISAAESIGIRPIENDFDAWSINRPVVRIESTRDYYIDNLTHSIPYLVPEARDLLTDIGRSFRDSLEARGGGDYRVKVTSLLRTRSSVNRLRRRNGNASAVSAHMYGTTFDISYSNFVCDSVTTPRTVEDMKHLLAEILRQYRDSGRCWVKHERKQSCFHITTRPVHE